MITTSQIKHESYAVCLGKSSEWFLEVCTMVVSSDNATHYSVLHPVLKQFFKNTIRVTRVSTDSMTVMILMVRVSLVMHRNEASLRKKDLEVVD